MRKRRERLISDTAASSKEKEMMVQAEGNDAKRDTVKYVHQKETTLNAIQKKYGDIYDLVSNDEWNEVHGKISSGGHPTYGANVY